MSSSQRVPICSRRILRPDSWLRCSKRQSESVCFQLLGVLLLLITNLSGILLRWLKKLDREGATLRKNAEMAATVEQARGALGTAEQNLMPARKPWLRRGATFTSLSKSTLLALLLAALWITMSVQGKARVCGSSWQQGRQRGRGRQPPEDADQETSGNSTASSKRRCQSFVVKWELRRPSAEKPIWQALRQLSKKGSGTACSCGKSR